MLRLVFPLLFTVSTAAIAGSLNSQQNSTQQQPQLSAHEEMNTVMESMCAGMDDMKMTGVIDNDFLLMMIPHHQSAVDMASAYLREGVAPEIRELAEKIIASQQKEIAEMKAWLEDHPVKSQQASK